MILEALTKMVRTKAGKKRPAPNERFCESGGVCPPELLCGFASVPPAQAFVSPRPRQAATMLGESRGKRVY